HCRAHRRLRCLAMLRRAREDPPDLLVQTRIWSRRIAKARPDAGLGSSAVSFLRGRKYEAEPQGLLRARRRAPRAASKKTPAREGARPTERQRALAWQLKRRRNKGMRE